jgi:two-component system OmpR family sensor kinase
MLRRARRNLALQIAAALTLAVAALGGCVYRTMVTEQQNEVNQWLAYDIDHGSPRDIEPCEWVFVLEDDGTVDRPALAPAGFPLAAALAAVPADGRPAGTSLSADGTVYRVMTERVGIRVVQAVFDTRYQRADRQHLVSALLIAELIGLGCVALVSAGLARRSISPLGEALARQRRFVADASHELRTPLTRLHLRAQLLLRRSADDLPEPLADELAHLVRGARELGDVVEDLLLSASLDPAARPGARVDLAALARQVLDAESARAEDRALVLDLGPGPASAAGYRVRGAESPLRRMISALVDNAIGHTKPAGRIVVALRTADRGRAVELDVSDDGAGFDPADGDRIFERFARGHGHDAHRFGLGLALVREVVESHGGTITAHGGPAGRGARFVVRLPAAPA